MHTPESIRRVDQIFVGRSIELPERPGVYAFWWIGPRADLMAGNRHIVLKGPGVQLSLARFRNLAALLPALAEQLLKPFRRQLGL